MSKEYELVNPEDLKEQAKIAKLKELEKSQKKEQKGNSLSVAKIAAEVQWQKRLQSFDRFNEDFVGTYMEERRLQRLPSKNAKKQKEEPLD